MRNVNSVRISCRPLSDLPSSSYRQFANPKLIQLTYLFTACRTQTECAPLHKQIQAHPAKSNPNQADQIKNRSEEHKCGLHRTIAHCPQIDRDLAAHMFWADVHHRLGWRHNQTDQVRLVNGGLASVQGVSTTFRRSKCSITNWNMTCHWYCYWHLLLIFVLFPHKGLGSGVRKVQAIPRV